MRNFMIVLLMLGTLAMTGCISVGGGGDDEPEVALVEILSDINLTMHGEQTVYVDYNDHVKNAEFCEFIPSAIELSAYHLVSSAWEGFIQEGNTTITFESKLVTEPYFGGFWLRCFNADNQRMDVEGHITVYPPDYDNPALLKDFNVSGLVPYGGSVHVKFDAEDNDTLQYVNVSIDGEAPYVYPGGDTNLSIDTLFDVSSLEVGEHNVTVTVVGYIGGEGNLSEVSETRNFSVVSEVSFNIPPVAYAGNDLNMTAGDTIAIIGAGSDYEGGELSYKWTEGGNILAETDIFSYTTTLVGEHTLTFTVTDPQGASASDEVVVTVTDPSTPAPTPQEECEANGGFWDGESCV